VTVRAGTAYRKIWRLVNNFVCSHNKVHCSEIPIVLSNLLYHYFFTELWHILILWLAKMPNGGMPVFTLIATGWRHTGKYTKKALNTNINTNDQVYRHTQNIISNRVVCLPTVEQAKVTRTWHILEVTARIRHRGVYSHSQRASGAKFGARFTKYLTIYRRIIQFIVRSIHDSGLEHAKIDLRNIVSWFTNIVN